MSKQRSWDGFRDEHGAEVWPDGGPTPREPGSNRFFTQRVRVVEWPEGAPPPEDVPHAGTEVECGWGDGTISGNVLNGIPYKDYRGWVLDVHPDDSVAMSGAWSGPLEHIRVIPEKRTASGEVVASATARRGDEITITVKRSGIYSVIVEDA